MIRRDRVAARAATLLGAILLAAGCSTESRPPIVAGAPADTALAVDTTAPVIIIDTLARDLVVPWGVAVAPDGRIFVTERRGRVLVLPAGGGPPVEWARLDVHAEDPAWGPESGLMGIALAPDFATTGQVYVSATRWRSDGDRRGALLTRVRRRIGGLVSPAAAIEHETRIIRFTERAGRGESPVVILDGVLANHYHAGGGLAFGPDGRLYAGFGDALTPAFPRDRRVLAGKIVRLEPDGSIPGDAAFTGSPVFAMGLRNPQAFDWLPDGTMLTVDHGPTGLSHEGGRAGRDELNVVRAGGDHGWPHTTGWEQAEGLTTPLWVWREAIAPAGLTVYRGPYAPWQGSVIVGALRGRLERIRLERRTDGWVAVAREPLFEQRFGRIRTVTSDPQGRLLVTTSDRDARGVARPGDDLLLRLTIQP